MGEVRAGLAGRLLGVASPTLIPADAHVAFEHFFRHVLPAHDQHEHEGWESSLEAVSRDAKEGTKFSAAHSASSGGDGRRPLGEYNAHGCGGSTGLGPVLGSAGPALQIRARQLHNDVCMHRADARAKFEIWYVAALRAEREHHQSSRRGRESPGIELGGPLCSDPLANVQPASIDAIARSFR